MDESCLSSSSSPVCETLWCSFEHKVGTHTLCIYCIQMLVRCQVTKSFVCKKMTPVIEKHRETHMYRDREQADSLKNSPPYKTTLLRPKTGPGVPLIAAICFSQHIVIALCSSIDFVLNPGLSQKLTVSTSWIPFHLLHLVLHLIFHILLSPCPIFSYW